MERERNGASRRCFGTDIGGDHRRLAPGRSQGVASRVYDRGFAMAGGNQELTWIRRALKDLTYPRERGNAVEVPVDTVVKGPAGGNRRHRRQWHRDQGARGELGQAELGERRGDEHADGQVHKINAVTAPAERAQRFERLQRRDAFVPSSACDQDEPERGRAHGGDKLVAAGDGENNQQRNVDCVFPASVGRAVESPVDRQTDRKLVPEVDERTLNPVQ